MMCGTVGRCGNQNMCVSPTTLSCCRIPDRRTHLVRVDLNRRHPLMVATWVDFNCHTCWNCIWLSRLPLNRIAVRKDSSQMGDATYIPDDLKTIDKSESIYPVEYEGHLDRLMIKHDTISARVRTLAAMIHQDYKGRRPVLVCILKGASPFYQHLLDALMDLRQGFLTEFFRVSSYEGTSSSGQVKFSGDFGVKNLIGRDVILVEDIIDTGTTLSHLIPLLREQCHSIKSVEVCSLLAKRLEAPAKVKAKYVGFSIPNHFIIGYGLDYNELYRDLKDIWVISTTGIQFDSSSL